MPGAITPSPTGVNLDALLARIHGNSAALRQLVELMLNHLPERLETIDRALAAQNSAGVCAAAHSLRGSLSNFTVGASWTLAGELEALTRTHVLEGAQQLADSLRDEVNAVDAELKAWLAEGST